MSEYCGVKTEITYRVIKYSYFKPDEKVRRMITECLLYFSMISLLERGYF